MKTAQYILLAIILSGATGCKKFLDIDPPVSKVTEESVYLLEGSAIGVINGIYTEMSQYGNNQGMLGLSFYLGLPADEFILWDATTNDYYVQLYRDNFRYPGTSLNFWGDAYRRLYAANAAIENVSKAPAIRPSVKQQLLAEAKFIRALYYFYLVNLYGDVPLTTTSDYKVNSSLSRTPKAKVYEQIVKDLQEASEELSDKYLDGTLSKEVTQRVRPTKWAALALLARTYLHTGQYALAEQAATEVIQNNGIIQLELDDLNKVFLIESREAIWQLQVISEFQNTWDGAQFVIPEIGLNNNQVVELSDDLVNSFEPGDKRKINWIGKYVDVNMTPYEDRYYAFKYKQPAIAGSSTTEYTVLFRLAEQYLIRAEARMHLENFDGARQDLNVIRSRAGLNDTNAGNDMLADAILKERRNEYFAELGHRWFDLIRMGRIDKVMSTAAQEKGGTWESHKQLFPTPGPLDNPNISQNPGY